MQDDPIWGWLVAQHGPTPWGRVLDAGTGVHSLRFLGGLEGAQVTAVTADEGMQRDVEALPDARGVRVVRGVWTDPALLHGERFDVVLADYLLGAVDAFTPYFEDRLLERLRPHVASRLYVVGLQPWGGARTEAERAFVDLIRARDAAMLLAGQRPYREFPQDYVERLLTRSGFRVVDARRFPIRLTRSTVDRQVRNTTGQLCCVPDGVAEPLRAHTLALQARLHALVGEGLTFGADYALAAQPV